MYPTYKYSSQVCDNTPAMQEIRDRMEGIARMEEKFQFQLVVKEVSDYLNNKTHNSDLRDIQVYTKCF